MKKIFMAGALLGAMFLQSCEDNDFGNNVGAGLPMEPGTTIVFGAGLSTQPGSRTMYGEDSGGAVKIHWKYSSAQDDETRNKGLDSIYIFSPHSDPDQDRGVYMVNPDGEYSINYAPVIVADEKKTLVAKKAQQSFYAVYPASAILQEPDAGDEENVWIYGVLSAHQKVTVDPEKITDNVMEAEHDMNLCFMKAVESNYALKAGQPVRLQFQPWSTVLDITIPGPTVADKDGKDYCEVTQVLVRTRKADKTGEGVDIAGTFRCNLKTDKIEFTRMPDETSTWDESNHIVNIDIVQPDGTRGVKLGIGQSLNLKGFLLPVADAEAVEVEVYSADNKMWSVFLRNMNNRDRLLEPGQIHRVTLPYITLPGKASYSSWMTNLSDDIPIADMSIPGSYMSFTYELSGEDQLQSYTITDQFNAGVRAFHTQVRFSYNEDEDMPGVATPDNNGKDCHLEITNDGNKNVMSLGKAIHELHQEMQSRGNREFCVLFLKLSANYGTLPHILECLKKYAKKMSELGLVDEVMPSEFTLGNFRGKILLQVLIPADPERLGLKWQYEQTTPKAQTLSPGQSIEQWLAHEKTTVASWTGMNALSSSGGLNSWKPIDGAPLLLSWETHGHNSTYGLTPVTYGRIGEWTYTPKYTTREDFVNNCSGWSTGGYDRFVYSNWPLKPTIPTDQAKIGLATMNASVIAANTQLLGEADGMTHDWCYRADLDIDLTKLAEGRYTLFGKDGAYTKSMYWWLHGESAYDGGTTQTAYNIMRDMWQTGGAARTWRGKLGQQLFITTVLGCNAYDGTFYGITPGNKGAANYCLATNWCNLVASKSAISSTGNIYFNVTGITIDQPLGIVFLPHVPSPEDKLPQTVPAGWGQQHAETFKLVGHYNTSQIIAAMIKHNDKYDPGKKTD